MAGHSKWANIKHRKAAQDAKRGKLFTKIIRELTVAAKNGGNPEDNPRLRTAIDKALSVNMTRDTIDRAVARGAGAGDNDQMEEITYEGYGAGGVAVLVECMTDNRNRTVSEVRHAFSKFGGNLGTDGSVAYLFDKKGQILIAGGSEEDAIMEAALEAGAEDIINQPDGSFLILTPWAEVTHIKEKLMEAGFSIEISEVAMLPSTKADVEDKKAEGLMKMLDHLEDLDDVQQVYSNAEFSDDFLQQLDS